MIVTSKHLETLLSQESCHQRRCVSPYKIFDRILKIFVQVSCYEPERLADKSWAEIESDDFACKPLAKMNQELVRVGPGQDKSLSPTLLTSVCPSLGMNISLECGVMGSPSPAVRWVRGGRILANMSSSPVANVANMKYLIRERTSLVGNAMPLF